MEGLIFLGIIIFIIIKFFSNNCEKEGHDFEGYYKRGKGFYHKCTKCGLEEHCIEGPPDWCSICGQDMEGPGR